MKPAREPASIGPKLCASLENAPGSLPVRSGRKKTHRGRRSAFPSDPFRFTPLIIAIAQGFSTPLTRRRSSCPPPSPNFVLTHPTERATVRLRVLRARPTRLSATVSLASRVPPPPEGHQTGARKRRTGWTLSSSNQTAAASQPTG